MRSAGGETRPARVSLQAGGKPHDRFPSRTTPRTHRGRLQVTVTDGEGRPVSAGGLAGWLTALAPRRAAGSLALALVSDAKMRSLNRRYRSVDAVTDVLSFPCEAFGGAQRGDAGVALGDIVIAKGRAVRQARAGGHSLETELRVLALHGLLHLLGYDHELDAGRMARVEQRLRREGGLRDGLMEREGGAGRRGPREPSATRGAGGPAISHDREGGAGRKKGCA